MWQTDEAKFFSENRTKIVLTNPSADQTAQTLQASSAGQSDSVSTVASMNHTLNRDDSNYYISAFSTRRGNPDMIVPGGSVKGNMYHCKPAAEKATPDNQSESDTLQKESAPE